MSVNKERPYVRVLPEDDANLQIANGFEKEVDCVRQFEVLKPAGGWSRVRDDFQEIYRRELARSSNAHIVLLVDFDDHEDRGKAVLGELPDTDPLRQRVFVLGARSNPEELKRALRLGFEAIGEWAADDCRQQNWSELWDAPLLSHNLPELKRAAQALRGILFKL